MAHTARKQLQTEDRGRGVVLWPAAPLAKGPWGTNFGNLGGRGQKKPVMYMHQSNPTAPPIHPTARIVSCRHSSHCATWLIGWVFLPVGAQGPPATRNSTGYEQTVGNGGAQRDGVHQLVRVGWGWHGCPTPQVAVIHTGLAPQHPRKSNKRAWDQTAGMSPVDWRKVHRSALGNHSLLKQPLLSSWGKQMAGRQWSSSASRCPPCPPCPSWHASLQP